MKFYYQLFTNEELIIQKFVGHWNVNHYDEYISMSVSTLKFANITKVLTDLRQMTVNMNMDDLEKVISIRKRIPITKYTNVHLVSTPDITVVSELYKMNLKATGQLGIEYCSTLEHAKKLLKLSVLPKEIEKRINQLENVFFCD